MKKFLFIQAIIALLLVSCSKQNPLSPEYNNPPQKFTITMLEREADTQELEWTEAVDPEGDAVSYSIELDGKILFKNLPNRKYILTSLLPDKTYTGRIIASDKKGLSVSQSFNIEVYQGQILMGTGYYSLGLMGLTNTGTISWRVGEYARSVPAVSGDVIFSGQEKVYAIKAKTGDVLWTNDLVQKENAAVLYAQNKVFITSEKKISALSAATGATLWSIPLQTTVNPSISKNILYISYREHLYAIDVNTGAIKWDFIAPASLGMAVAKDGTLYVLSAAYYQIDGEGYMYALDANTGTLKWRSKFSGQISLTTAPFVGSPVLYGNKVYFVSHNDKGYDGQFRYVYAMDAATGTVVWKKTVALVVPASGLIVDESGIYLSASSLMKLDRVTGNVIWSIEGNFMNELVLTGDKIYVSTGSASLSLNVFDAGTGNRIGNQIRSTFPYGGSPVVLKSGKAYYPPSSGMNTVN